MKTILMSLASLFLATAALATPAVGDYAKYNVTISQGNQKMSLIAEQTITAFDQAANQYTVQTTYNYNGQSQIDSAQKPADEFVSDAMAKDIIANCASYQGTLEQVTVPAGKFNSCKLPTSDGNGGTGSINLVAGVAFGIVKGTSTEQGKVTNVELLAFTNGK
ncbi:hypothetical protein [Bdellovibrio sp. HCB337]|uniref:hypothetical protein n=1 Tax=Bdellovibrio sp. HCB337 TaxID=3394358 RepID=UPI0039A5C4B8